MPGDASPDEVLPEYVRALLRPDAYPSPPPDVELRQTHVSYVFLAGDVVYKTKKPVDFGFIDQVAPERREAFCHAEVRLNRRLAPDVYLGVGPIVRHPDGRIAVLAAGEPPPGDAEVVEWCVQMRRLPDDRTLRELLPAGEAPPRVAEHVVRQLIAFHEAAEVVESDPDFAGAAGDAAWWEREYGETEGFIGSTWAAGNAAATRNFVASELEREWALFDARLADGRVIEGHGDLRADHVYVLDDTGEDLAIVDCIEFSEWYHFRYLDAGYDIAFLAMDLEALGFAELGDEIAGRYIAASGDETMGVLQPLHRAFRAFVRGKVESIGAHAPEVSEEQRAALAESAAQFFHLAASFGERRAEPAVVVMCGLPATGKSTVAGTLASRIGAAYVSSDIVRKQLAGIDPRERADEAFRAGLYSPEMTERTYTELRRHVREHLDAGRAVVIDAMHGRASEREAARALTAEHGVPCLVAELHLDEATARARIAGREDDPLRTSDATEDVYALQRDRFEPVGGGEGPSITLDASRPPGALARDVAEALAGLRA
ncbi:MAG: AAA family ATPase [Chloroflexi bacterium]|nr:AAA family ATPase [Chloroflexota bacterium]